MRTAGTATWPRSGGPWPHGWTSTPVTRTRPRCVSISAGRGARTWPTGAATWAGECSYCGPPAERSLRPGRQARFDAELVALRVLHDHTVLVALQDPGAQGLQPRYLLGGRAP